MNKNKEVKMERIIIQNVEEILTIPKSVKTVEISQHDVIRYIYINRTNSDSSINIQELRNVYGKSINKSYKEKKYLENLVLNEKDIKSLCIV